MDDDQATWTPDGVNDFLRTLEGTTMHERLDPLWDVPLSQLAEFLNLALRETPR